ncbi:Uncharacterised protein [Mycobacteroides abscessus subsp. abscessus]|nr:Uncharacterised protein [Mycobacteroides abscessus subsp. abscessus]
MTAPEMLFASAPTDAPAELSAVGSTVIGPVTAQDHIWWFLLAADE